MFSQWFLCLVIPIAPAPTTTAPLWSKAVAIAAVSQNEFPQRMSETELIVNEKGRLDEEIQTLYSITLGSDLKPKAKLIRSLKNKEDNTAAKQAELEKGDGEDLFSETDHPFHPKWQPLVTFTKTERRETIRGKVCVVFEYTFRAPDAVWTGVAYLTVKDGIPMRTVAKPDRFPLMEDVKIVNMINTADYEMPEPGRWRTTRYVVKAKIEVRIMPFVTYKGTSTTTYRFDDYVRLSVP